MSFASGLNLQVVRLMTLSSFKETFDEVHKKVWNAENRSSDQQLKGIQLPESNGILEPARAANNIPVSCQAEANWSRSNSHCLLRFECKCS